MWSSQRDAAKGSSDCLVAANYFRVPLASHLDAIARQAKQRRAIGCKRQRPCQADDLCPCDAGWDKARWPSDRLQPKDARSNVGGGESKKCAIVRQRRGEHVVAVGHGDLKRENGLDASFCGRRCGFLQPPQLNYVGQLHRDEPRARRCRANVGLE